VPVYASGVQELVLPSDPVTDYRTQLTGISASDLEGVSLTRKAAAKRLAKLLTPSTVLVGHGLHHDLQALKLDHPWVIDTSMIFEFK
jgi:RNA exonuclease 1